jgi:hypothetical protein
VSSQSPKRRIPQDTERANKIIAGRSYSDLAIFVGAPVVGGAFLLYLRIISGVQFIGLISAVAIADAILLRLIPQEESVTIWVRGLAHHIATGETTHSQFLPEDVGETDPRTYDITLETDGGEKEIESPDELVSPWWKSDKTTIEQIGLKNIYPEEAVMLRDDGCLVAAVEVVGRDISLAAKSENQRLIQQYATHLNSVDFDYTTYITDEKFNLDEQIDHSKSRLRSEFVENRPILMYLQQTKIQQMEYNTGKRGVRQRRTFEIVSVDPEEHHDIDETPFSFIEPNTRLGNLIGLEDEGISKKERQYTRALTEIESRVQTLVGSIGKISGVSVSRADVDTLTTIVSEHAQQRDHDGKNWQPQETPFVQDANDSNTPTKKELFEKHSDNSG